MTGLRSPLFRCTNRAALNQVSRAKSDLLRYREITCRSCGGPLPAREGKFALKFSYLRPRIKAEQGRQSRHHRVSKSGDATGIADQPAAPAWHHFEPKTRKIVCGQGRRSREASVADSDQLLNPFDGFEVPARRVAKTKGSGQK